MSELLPIFLIHSLLAECLHRVSSCIFFQSDHSKITVAQMASDSDGLDIIMHAGDISYAYEYFLTSILVTSFSTFFLCLFVCCLSVSNGDQPIWDSWGAMIEGLSSITPWMVTAGNHESYDNFLPFKHRFAMPAKESGSNEGDMYWSVDYALMHIVAMSTEITYTSGSAQYKWAANDIANVDRSVVRNIMPRIAFNRVCVF